jgi:hypothetical protein
MEKRGCCRISFNWTFTTSCTIHTIQYICLFFTVTSTKVVVLPHIAALFIVCLHIHLLAIFSLIRWYPAAIWLLDFTALTFVCSSKQAVSNLVQSQGHPKVKAGAVYVNTRRLFLVVQLGFQAADSAVMDW